MRQRCFPWLVYNEVTNLGGLLVKTPPILVGGRFSFALCR